MASPDAVALQVPWPLIRSFMVVVAPCSIFGQYDPVVLLDRLMCFDSKDIKLYRDRIHRRMCDGTLTFECGLWFQWCRPARAPMIVACPAPHGKATVRPPG